MRINLIMYFLCLGILNSVLNAQEIPAEFQVKRKEVFEFTRTPSIKSEGKDIVIEFESKDYCDATVVIEDSAGNIIRHLVSGVLGKNAPEPFKKDSLSQIVNWDKKNDIGKYIDNLDDLSVRVSLGLKPIFEKTLFWSPYKRIGGGYPVLAASEEGVFIFEGSGVDSLRKYNHDGVYEKTLYPFAKAALKTVKDIRYEKFPQDGAVLPIKHGSKCKSTFFTFDKGNAHDKYGSAASTIAVNKKNICIAAEDFSRITTDGEVPESGFDGARSSIEITDKIKLVTPLSSAFSNDGKWVYTTGYKVSTGYQAPMNGHWLPVVMRSEYNSKEPAKVFIGDTKQASSGSGDGQLKVPLCVTVDSADNILVADYMNDRIQVFDKEGKFLKAMKVEKPVVIGSHPKTKQILACSWMVLNDFNINSNSKLPAKYTRFTSVENPTVEFQCNLPFNDYDDSSNFMNRTGGLQFKICFDFWKEDLRIWILPGLPYTFGNGGVIQHKAQLKGSGITMFKEKDNKLVEAMDFNNEVTKAVVRAKPCGLIRQRMYVNPVDGLLYISETDSGDGKSFMQLVSINANNNEQKLVNIPFTAEDMCIDLEGFFYLRTDLNVVRYEPKTWKEIPFDYGIEKSSVGFAPPKYSNVISGIALPANGRDAWWHNGGMAVGPNGDIVVSCFNSATGQSQTTANDHEYGSAVQKISKQTYIPQVFPGRKVNWDIHIWDKHGKPKFQDAFPGAFVTNGIGIDKDDNLYVLIDENRMLGSKPYLINWANTLVKVKAGKSKMVTDSKDVPLALAKEAAPAREKDFDSGWIENAEWIYGGVGFSGWRSGSSCICWNARPALDLLGRSFAPEIDHYSVAVLDTNGNLILRIGQYGNVDDGKPLIVDGGPKNPISIGGDEVALFHAAYLATHSDRRLFISDGGNSRIISVKLDYHNNHKTKLAESKK